MEILIFSVLALLAEIIGTVGGFGSSMLFVPLAGLFFDFKIVLGLTAVFHLFSNISKISMFRNGLDRRIILKIGIPAVLFVIFGAWMSKFVSPSASQLLLGSFLTITSLFLFLNPAFILKPTTINSVTGGALSGLAAGLLGTGGAIRGLTLAAFDLEKNIFIATSAVIDLGIDLSRTVVYFGNGYMRKEDLYLVPVLIVVSALGTYLGKKLLVFFSQKQFKKLVLILTLLVGAVSLFKYFLDQ
jgi:uncharacterized membrane protein YfcA